MRELTVCPEQEGMEIPARFVENTLRAEGCPENLVMRMNVVFDELFSNIFRYSEASEASIICGVEEGEAILRLVDNGKPYDPTAAPEPDITLPADMRGIGGLGISMVRKMTDKMSYAYENGKNVLTVYKRLV